MSNNNIHNDEPRKRQEANMKKREEMKALRERLKNQDISDLENDADGTKLKKLAKIIFNKDIILPASIGGRPTSQAIINTYKRRIKNILDDYKLFLHDSKGAAGKKHKKKLKSRVKKSKSKCKGKGKKSKCK